MNKNINKTAFTLVELIVVLVILAILSTIAFMSYQWYTAWARNSKRASDVSGLITKITIANAQWLYYEDLIWTWATENKLTINAATWTWLTWTWFQNIENPINWTKLWENVDNFRDPLNGHPYPFAYIVWRANGEYFNFIQMAYVEEGSWIWVTRIMWSYYKMDDLDSPSLFTLEWKDWINIPDDYILDWGEPIYSLN
jgi:prepilin-type N-terminal cleavage/methylation domain-containing protein